MYQAEKKLNSAADSKLKIIYMTAIGFTFFSFGSGRDIEYIQIKHRLPVPGRGSPVYIILKVCPVPASTLETGGVIIKGTLTESGGLYALPVSSHA